MIRKSPIMMNMAYFAHLPSVESSQFVIRIRCGLFITYLCLILSDLRTLLYSLQIHKSGKCIFRSQIGFIWWRISGHEETYMPRRGYSRNPGVVEGIALLYQVDTMFVLVLHRLLYSIDVRMQTCSRTYSSESSRSILLFKRLM